eukprot:1365754-Rhodomonas_salina.2
MRVPHHRSKRQRAVCRLGRILPRGAALEQELARFAAPVLRGQVQRREAAQVHGVDVRADVEEFAAEERPAGRSCGVEDGDAEVVARVDVGAALQEELDGGAVR